MPLTTVTVSIAVDLVLGTPLPLGSVRFELTAADIDGAIVAPQPATVTLDPAGLGSVALWPNARGTQGTQYRVIMRNAAGELQLSALATVPASNCYLHDILNLVAPPVVDDAQAAALAAQGYSSGAGTSASAAHADRLAADADATATAADRVQTGQDRVQTGLDRAAAAGSAADAASSKAAVDNKYRGTLGADPVQRPDGTANQAGDWYTTTSGAAKVYVGGVWAIVTGASAVDLANSSDTTRGSALVGDPDLGGSLYDRLNVDLELGRNGFPQSHGSTGLIFAGIDSLTDGAGGSTWRTYFKSMLRGAFGDCGPGYHGFTLGTASVEGVSFGKSGGCTYVTLTDGLYGTYSLDGNGLYVAAGAGTDNFSWVPANYWTTARIYYLKQPGGGTFKVRESSLTSAGDVLVDTSNASVDLGFIDVAYIPYGQHGLNFTAITGNVCIFGANFQVAGSKGVALVDVAAGGRTLASVAAQNSAMRIKWYQALTPSHFLLDGGMNDRTGTSIRTATQHESDLTTLVTDIQTASPTTNVIMVQSNEPSDAATTNFNSFFAKKVAVAKAKKLMFVDVRRALGNYAYAVAQGRMADAIHPNDFGNRIKAPLYARAVGVWFGGKDPGLTAYPSAPGGSIVRRGTLTDKQGALTVSTPQLLWKIGLINGFPTCGFKVRVWAQRTATSVITVREFVFKITNGTSLNNATGVSGSPGNTLLVKELAGDSQGIDFTLGLAINANLAEVSITPSGFSGSYYATGEWFFTSLTQSGTSVIEN